MCQEYLLAGYHGISTHNSMTPISLADMNKGATYSLFPRAFYEHQNHKGNIFK